MAKGYASFFIYSLVKIRQPDIVFFNSHENGMINTCAGNTEGVVLILRGLTLEPAPVSQLIKNPLYDNFQIRIEPRRIIPSPT